MNNATHIPSSGGTFGLERETLRVTSDGRMAHTPHPFPEDAHIVKDFCENQAEINTGVHAAAQGAVDELLEHSKRLCAAIRGRGERLWLYSNPPMIKNADDIPVAVFHGEQKSKYDYRLYLAEKYGKYIMTLSGIHVNYSLPEELLRAQFASSGATDYSEYKNAAYLRLAQGMTEYCFLLKLLLSASPICDGSYFDPARSGETVVTDYASLRCGKDGYWNDFTPILCYDSVHAYAHSIQKYLDEDVLAGVSELYYPIRLKPRGANRLELLTQYGVNHIELRNIDVNPFAESGVDVRDLEFIELLCLWVYHTYADALSEENQRRAVGNFKTAALLDIDSATVLTPQEERLTVREAGNRVLDTMRTYYGEDQRAAALLQYQQDKLNPPGRRYAERVIKDFSDKYDDVML